MMKDVKNVAKKRKKSKKKTRNSLLALIMGSKIILVILEIQGVMAVENDEFERPLDPDAESLAYKMQNFLKSKAGKPYFQPVRLKGNKTKYYWSFMEKAFVLIHGDSELYLVPWKETRKRVNSMFIFSL